MYIDAIAHMAVRGWVECARAGGAGGAGGGKYVCVSTQDSGPYRTRRIETRTAADSTCACAAVDLFAPRPSRGTRCALPSHSRVLSRLLMPLPTLPVVGLASPRTFIVHVAFCAVARALCHFRHVSHCGKLQGRNFAAPFDLLRNDTVQRCERWLQRLCRRRRRRIGTARDGALLSYTCRQHVTW